MEIEKQLENPPAFPVEITYGPNGEIQGVQTSIASGWHTGMNLRDYFAANALTGIIALCKNDTTKANECKEQMLARKAYELADYMLKERSK